MTVIRQLYKKTDINFFSLVCVRVFVRQGAMEQAISALWHGLSDRTRFGVLLSAAHTIPALISFILYTAVECSPAFDRYKIQPKQRPNFVASSLRQWLFPQANDTTPRGTAAQPPAPPTQQRTSLATVSKCLRQLLVSHLVVVPLLFYGPGYNVAQQLLLFSNGGGGRPSPAETTSAVLQTPITQIMAVALRPFFLEPNADRHAFLPSLFEQAYPPWYIVVGQLLFFIVVEDALFYWVHRMLHEVPGLYARVHKKHHDFRSPITIAAEYAHPVETLLGNFVPFLTGPILWPTHPTVFAAWMAIRIFKTAEAHSGYASLPWQLFSWCPRWLTSSRRHDFHHSENSGCYASFFTFWDWACGTDATFVRKHPLGEVISSHTP